MSRDADWHPLYLDGANGPLFAIWYRPADTVAPTVLYLPPFAEEMNRSRRTIAALGRAMAGRGWGIGDSASNFEEASCAGWRADASTAVRFIQAQGHRVAGTMGLRTGAFLALATARAHELERAVLCQPVDSGRSYVTGLLRSRVAAAQAGAGPRVTVADLRETLAAGASIELMGYPLSPALSAGLEAIDLVEAGTGFAGRVDWLRMAPRATDAVPQKTADEMERLSGAIAGPFAGRTVEATAFWMLEETPIADRFVSETVDMWLSPNAREAA